MHLSFYIYYYTLIFVFEPLFLTPLLSFILLPSLWRDYYKMEASDSHWDVELLFIHYDFLLYTFLLLSPPLWSDLYFVNMRINGDKSIWLRWIFFRTPKCSNRTSDFKVCILPNISDLIIVLHVFNKGPLHGTQKLFYFTVKTSNLKDIFKVKESINDYCFINVNLWAWFLRKKLSKIIYLSVEKICNASS